VTEPLFREDPYLKSCDAMVLSAGVEGICVDRTVFYAMGGGQPGDTGKIVRANGDAIRITDTRKAADSSAILHIPDGTKPLPEAGETVQMSIDWERRHRFMRMHSCMHLLCAVIPAPVTGGSISDGRGRLDFDLPEPPDKEQITTRLNALIEEDRQRRLRWITDEEMAQQPELVRTMSVQPPSGSGRVRLVEFDGIDLQPCGGTHVASTGEIGAVRIAKIEKKGKHNRRVIVEFVDN